MIRLIKRLFCNHDYDFLRPISGDEINWTGGMRSVFICLKCRKVVYSRHPHYLD